MKCLILAAGYATRLYPLTENFPKPLLEVGGKPILDWLIEDLDATGRIDRYYVVTNHKFAPIFEKWVSARHSWLDLSRHSRPDTARHARLDRASAPITVVDDGTCSNETRLGAVRDIQFAIEQCGIDDDLLVMAGDNLLSFGLKTFIDYFDAKGTTCIMRYYEEDKARLLKSGIVEVDDTDRIISMEEKPAAPRSNWVCPPFYIYRRCDLKLVARGIEDGCATDAPGSFIAWLCKQTPVHAWQMSGRRFDIGTIASYQEVKKIFEQKSE